MTDMMQTVDEQAVAAVRDILAAVRSRLDSLARTVEAGGGAMPVQDTTGRTFKGYGPAYWNGGAAAAYGLFLASLILDAVADDGGFDSGKQGFGEEVLGVELEDSTRFESWAVAEGFDWDDRNPTGPPYVVTAAHVAECIAHEQRTDAERASA